MLTVILSLCIASLTANKQTLRFRAWGYAVPHPAKADRGGEDAHYLSANLLVVADGVGGWNNQGVNPALYSRFLCAAAEVYFSEDPVFYSKRPVELIARAAQKNPHIGSSTMSVVTLDGQSLRACHLGGNKFLIKDCKLLVLRRYGNRYHIIHESSQLQHDFNYPFQLAQKRYGGDSPYESLCYSVDARPGDILVLGSDGLFDNIFTHQIKAAVDKASRGRNLHELPRKIAMKASERGGDQKFYSPFEEQARREGLRYKGGKLDDATVIVAEVVEDLGPKQLDEL